MNTRRVDNNSRCLLIIPLLLTFGFTTTTSNGDFRVIKVTRYAEKAVRNSFQMRSTDKDRLCESSVCEKRNSYLTMGSGSNVCQCQCKAISIYSTADDHCIRGQSYGEFSLKDKNQILIFTKTSLLSASRIRYCQSFTSCYTSGVSNCRIDPKASFYDDNGWKLLWSKDNPEDFEIINGTLFKLKESSTKQLSGKLLQISITCDVDGVGMDHTSLLFFTVAGQFIVSPPPSTYTVLETSTLASVTSTVAVSSTTQVPTDSYTSLSAEILTSTPPTKHEYTPTESTLFIQTSPIQIDLTRILTPSMTVTPSNNIIATTSLQSTLNIKTQMLDSQHAIYPTTSQLKTMPLTENLEISSTSSREYMEASSTISPTEIRNNTHPTPKKDQHNSEEKEKNSKMLLIIITTVLGTFLVFSCILALCFYHRWKTAKKQRTNDHSMAEPSFIFHTETPVFLIGREGPSNRLKRSATDGRATASDPNLYTDGKRDVKKGGSIRQLYASIDKFLKVKPSTKNKSNGSLDEGYTTDDNYDYRRFAAFPNNLYDEPGSIVSSLDEPEYRIPEDFITSQMSIGKNNIEGDYLSPIDSVPPKPPRTFVNFDAKRAALEESEADSSNDGHYDRIGSPSLSTQIQEACHAYDEVGQALQDKIEAQEHEKVLSEDEYDEPHDSISNIVKRKQSRGNSILNIVQNPHALEEEQC